MHGLRQVALGDQRLDLLLFLAVAAQRQRHRAAVGAQFRHRFDEQVGALDVTELADIDDVGRVRIGLNGIELGRAHAVEDAAHGRFRRADEALIRVACEQAFEQEQIGAADQHAFERGVERAFHGRRRIMQHAAMRRVDTHDVLADRGEADQRTRFGAVAVQDGGIERANQMGEFGNGEHIRRVRRPSHRHPVHAQRHFRRDGFQRRGGAVAAGQAVGDDADLMAAVGLSRRQIEDVADDAADRRADGVENAKRLVLWRVRCRRHGRIRHHQTREAPVLPKRREKIRSHLMHEALKIR